MACSSLVCFSLPRLFSAEPERRILKYSSSRRAGALRAISWRCVSIASTIGWIDVEIEPRREDDRAQHAHRVLEEPDLGIADRSDQPTSKILETVDVVDDRVRGDVVEERVDREIAPEGVFLRRAERVVAVDHADRAARRLARWVPSDSVCSRARIRRIGDPFRCGLDQFVDTGRHLRRDRPVVGMWQPRWSWVRTSHERAGTAGR